MFLRKCVQETLVCNNLFHNDMYMRLHVLVTKEGHSSGPCLDPVVCFKTKEMKSYDARLLKVFDNLSDLINNDKFVGLYTPEPKKLHPRCNFYTTYKIINYDIIYDDKEETISKRLQECFTK